MTGVSLMSAVTLVFARAALTSKDQCEIVLALQVTDVVVTTHWLRNSVRHAKGISGKRKNVR